MTQCCPPRRLLSGRDRSRRQDEVTHVPAPHRKALALASFELAAHDGPPRVASEHAGQARVAPCTARACRRLPRSRPSSRISLSSAGTGHRTFLHPASGLPGETYAQFDSGRVHGGVGTMGIAWRSSADPQDGSGPASTGDCRTFSCTDGTARRMDSTRRAGLIGQPGPRTGPRRMPRDGP